MEYYVMFDMSPLDSYDQDYIQVGIAPRNKFVDIGQVRYDPKFEDYERADKRLDSSSIAPGFQD
jgi:hypothetical protein